MSFENLLKVAEQELGLSFDAKVVEEDSNSIVKLESEDRKFIAKVFDNEESNREKWFRAEPLIYQLLDEDHVSLCPK